MRTTLHVSLYIQFKFCTMRCNAECSVGSILSVGKMDKNKYFRLIRSESFGRSKPSCQFEWDFKHMPPQNLQRSRCVLVYIHPLLTGHFLTRIVNFILGKIRCKHTSDRRLTKPSWTYRNLRRPRCVSVESERIPVAYAIRELRANIQSSVWHATFIKHRPCNADRCCLAWRAQNTHGLLVVVQPATYLLTAALKTIYWTTYA